MKPKCESLRTTTSIRANSNTAKGGLAAIIQKTGLAGHRNPGLSRRASIAPLHQNIKPPAKKPPIPKSKKRDDSDDDGELWVDPVRAARDKKLREELGLEADEDIPTEHKKKLMMGSEDEPQYASD